MATADASGRYRGRSICSSVVRRWISCSKSAVDLCAAAENLISGNRALLTACYLMLNLFVLHLLFP